MGRSNLKRNDTNEGKLIMIGITLSFDYPWAGDSLDENDITEALSELSADELLINAMKAGKTVNVDIEVY